MNGYRRFLYNIAKVMGPLIVAVLPLFGLARVMEEGVPLTSPIPTHMPPSVGTGGLDLIAYYQKQFAELKQPTLQQLATFVYIAQSLTDSLKAQVQLVTESRNAGYIVSMVSDSGLSTVVAGSKAAPLAQIRMDATKAVADANISSLTLILEAPEDFSQKGLSDCIVWSEADIPVALNKGVHLLPTKNDITSVVFSFLKPFVVPKGAYYTLTLTCDTTKNPQGFATYTWWLGAATAKKALLIPSGSFVLEIADSSPAARNIKGGSKSEVATVFDFYAAGEAVQLQTLALQIDGNPRAVTAYSLWDGDIQVGGSTLSGDSVFKANFSSPFEIPKDSHKLLTVKVDMAAVTAGGSVQEGDSVAINFDGNSNNFHLTHGIGVSSDHGIIPSTQADTEAPAMTLAD